MASWSRSLSWPEPQHHDLTALMLLERSPLLPQSSRLSLTISIYQCYYAANQGRKHVHSQGCLNIIELRPESSL